MEPTDLPIACSLGADELPKRLAEIRAVGADALIAAEPDGRLRFRGDPRTRARLEAIVAAERDCCAFLTFDLGEDRGELTLSIAGPPDAEPVARDLRAAFAA
jgi:hypothetical protein